MSNNPSKIPINELSVSQAISDFKDLETKYDFRITEDPRERVLSKFYYYYVEQNFNIDIKSATRDSYFKDRTINNYEDAKKFLDDRIGDAYAMKFAQIYKELPLNRSSIFKTDRYANIPKDHPWETLEPTLRKIMEKKLILRNYYGGETYKYWQFINALNDFLLYVIRVPSLDIKEYERSLPGLEEAINNAQSIFIIKLYKNGRVDLTFNSPDMHKTALDFFINYFLEDIRDVY